MQKQLGMTLIGMLMTMVVVIVAAIVVLRVVPVYLQHYSIGQSIQELESIPPSSITGDALTDVNTLRASLTKRLDMNGVEDLKANELKITPAGSNKFIIKLKYQAIRPLISNVSILFNFDETREVVLKSEN